MMSHRKEGLVMRRSQQWLPLFSPLAILVLLLAACGTQPSTSTPATGGQAEATTNKLEMFSWWTAGGEADGLNAMYGLYKKAYPNVEIINATVAGGAGTNA